MHDVRAAFDDVGLERTCRTVDAPGRLISDTRTIAVAYGEIVLSVHELEHGN